MSILFSCVCVCVCVCLLSSIKCISLPHQHLYDYHFCNDDAKKIVEMVLASTGEHSCACVNAINGHVIDSCGRG